MKDNFWISMLDKIVNPLVYQIRIVFLFTLICFLQNGLFLFSLENISVFQVLNLNGIFYILIFFLFFTILALIIFNISTFVMWMTAKLLKGQGTYSQTFKAFVWALIYFSIPFSVFFIFLQFNLSAPYIVRKIIQFGMRTSLIFGFFIMLKKISECHNFSYIRSFFTLLITAGALFPFILVAMYLSKMHGDFNDTLRYLFVFIMPIAVQLIVMLMFILPFKFLATKKHGFQG